MRPRPAPTVHANQSSRRDRATNHALVVALCVVLGGILAWTFVKPDSNPVLAGSRPSDERRLRPKDEHVSVADFSPQLSAIDARGKAVTLVTPPKRIVSLSPGTTEMLFALGLKGRIVADTTYCDYPPEAKLLPKIGDVNTSTEKVIAQRPDLVVADALANRGAVESLERLHLTLFAVKPQSMRESFDALRSLGKITGQTAQADRLIRDLEGRVARVRRIVAPLPKPKVLDVVQMDPLMVVGAGNFMDDIITTAGGENLGRLGGNGWVSFSPERVIVHRPDVILTGRSGIQAVMSRAGWSHIPAVQNRAVYGIAYEAVRPGPRLVDALEEIAALLHPHEFKRR